MVSPIDLCVFTPRKAGRPKGSTNGIKKAIDIKQVINVKNGPGTPLFEKGNSPRSAGRPKGAKNKSTLIYEQIGSDNGVAIYQKLCDLALGKTKEGDVTACKIILDKVYPGRKGNTHDLEYTGEIDTIQDINELSKYVLKMLISGKISGEESDIYSKEIERRIKVISDSAVMDKINSTCQKIDDIKNGIL